MEKKRIIIINKAAAGQKAPAYPDRSGEVPKAPVPRYRSLDTKTVIYIAKKLNYIETDADGTIQTDLWRDFFSDIRSYYPDGSEALANEGCVWQLEGEFPENYEKSDPAAYAIGLIEGYQHTFNSSIKTVGTSYRIKLINLKQLRTVAVGYSPKDYYEYYFKNESLSGRNWTEEEAPAIPEIYEEECKARVGAYIACELQFYRDKKDTDRIQLKNIFSFKDPAAFRILSDLVGAKFHTIKIEAQKSGISDLKAENDRLQSEISELKAQLANDEAETQKLRDEKDALAKETDRLQKDIAHLNGLSTELEEQKNTLQSAIQQKIKKSRAYLEKKVTDLEAEIRRQKEVLGGRPAELEKLKKEVQAWEEKLSPVREELAEAEAEYRRIEEALDRKRQKIRTIAGETYEELRPQLKRIEKAEDELRYCDLLHEKIVCDKQAEAALEEKLRDDKEGVGWKDAETKDFTLLCDHVTNYLQLRGIWFPDELSVVRRFLSAVGSGQIILLAGTPGCGKTSLTGRIADAIGARTCMIPVQPNWTDNQDLLGFYSIKGKDTVFVSTPFTDALTEAAEHPDRMHFILLDEINISHVEYYFSVILSVMETSDRRLALSGGVRGKDSPLKMPERLPENIQFIGTVNMDELSKNISPKVLDRSFVIELPAVSDRETAVPVDDRIGPWPLSSDFFCKERQCVEASDTERTAQIEGLKKVYQALDPKKLSDADTDIFGERLCFSKRNQRQAECMLEKGATIGDLVLGKLLPALNWELNESGYSKVESILAEAAATANGEDMRIPEKLKEMKDVYDREGERILLDYWKSTRR